MPPSESEQKASANQVPAILLFLPEVSPVLHLEKLTV